MTPEQINIAIAEACGWNHIDPVRVNGPEGYKPDVEGDVWSYIPNYYGDLNAMHEAEKALNNDQRFASREWLKRLCNNKWHDACGATAPQRAEAFLRTIGKWVNQ